MSILLATLDHQRADRMRKDKATLVKGSEAERVNGSGAGQIPPPFGVGMTRLEDYVTRFEVRPS